MLTEYQLIDYYTTDMQYNSKKINIKIINEEKADNFLNNSKGEGVSYLKYSKITNCLDWSLEEYHKFIDMTTPRDDNLIPLYKLIIENLDTGEVITEYKDMYPQYGNLKFLSYKCPFI